MLCAAAILCVCVRACVCACVPSAVPLCRMDAIALDAELQERSLQDLKSLAKSLSEACAAAKKLSPASGAKTTTAVSLGGVTLSVDPLLRRQAELERLRACLPSTAKARRKYGTTHCPPHSAVIYIPYGHTP